MLENYPAKYFDKFGEECTTIQNNGKELKMVVRGSEFSGTSLDDWEPTDKNNPELSNLFLIHPMRNTIYQYGLKFEIQIPVVKQTKILPATLKVNLEIAVLETNKAGGQEDLKLDLYVDEKVFSSCGKHGWFEDELQEIKNVLPEGMYIKSCINCAFSGYSPAGFGLFGSLECFKNSKQEFLSLKSKAAYFKLEDKAELVQETFLCPEFQIQALGITKN